jgi:hypothetical protein
MEDVLTQIGKKKKKKKKKKEALSLQLKMIIISKEVVCIFYCKEYNKANAAIFLKRIEEMEEVDVCYLTDPRRPILQCTSRIYGSPDEYRLYLSINKEEKVIKGKESNISFGN